MSIVITYDDYIYSLFRGIPCILAYDTAADYLGLTNLSCREELQIYVTEKQLIPNVKNVEQIIVRSFDEKEYCEKHGMLCTTVNQTIIDLLERNGDEQIITESLATYYDEHNQSFEGLVIPKHLNANFEKYGEWAKTYYEE